MGVDCWPLNGHFANCRRKNKFTKPTHKTNHHGHLHRNPLLSRPRIHIPPWAKGKSSTQKCLKKGICDLFLKGNPILLLVTQLFFWVKSELPLHSKLLGSMYGIFTYIYHKKINHSCRFSYTNHPMDPMGSRYTLSG